MKNFGYQVVAALMIVYIVRSADDIPSSIISGDPKETLYAVTRFLLIAVFFGHLVLIGKEIR